MSERIYRDPVHNIIRLRTDTDEGRLMVRLIDSFEFQRLRLTVREECKKIREGDPVRRRSTR